MRGIRYAEAGSRTDDLRKRNAMRNDMRKRDAESSIRA